MKKSNTGILIGVLVVIVALIAVFSFTSSCQGKTYIETSKFEQSIGLGVDDETGDTVFSGKWDLSPYKIKGNNNLLPSRIAEVKFDNYNVYITVAYTNSAASSDKEVYRTYYTNQQSAQDTLNYKGAILKINENLKTQGVAEDKLIIYDGTDPNAGSIWSSIIPYVIMVVLMIVAFIFISRSMGGGTKSAMNFAKTNARQTHNLKVRFTDVAGAEEEKEELQEVVEFLKNPKKFSELGARIPKGVLLVGPPGTGKTLFAKAVAGEAGVPFFSISGSDFVEMFVGVGASRVRDLFDAAKKNQPCIVFIDEIDAVGRQRGTGLGGGHDEREQTLNQLLVQMDGFETNEGIIVMAATNRADILDPALLRPSRFDRQIYVGYPDIKGREDVLKIHTANKPLAEDVDLAKVARGTAGFTGADLENLSNEAALLCARRGDQFITMADFEEAEIKVLAGPEKRSRVVPEHERKLTAYHEAGHAVVMHALPTHEPVHRITIVPRGHAGGMTISLPDEDHSYQSKRYMEEQIVSLLGGRAAEKLMLGDISTGASNDIERASHIARKMVTAYGMSEKLGSIAFESGHDEVFIGKTMGQTRSYSEKTAAEIDDEVKAIIDRAYARCEEILTARREVLTAVAEYLLAHETMTGEEFERMVGEKA